MTNPAKVTHWFPFFYFRVCWVDYFIVLGCVKVPRKSKLNFCGFQYEYVHIKVLYKLVWFKTMTEFAFENVGTVSLYPRYRWTALMTSFCTSGAHQIFCPIKCCLESEMSRPQNYIIIMYAHDVMVARDRHGHTHWVEQRLSGSISVA